MKQETRLNLWVGTFFFCIVFTVIGSIWLSIYREQLAGTIFYFYGIFHCTGTYFYGNYKLTSHKTRKAKQ